MPSRDIYEQVVELWRSRGVPLMPPAAPHEVGDAFEALSYPLSANVRNLYHIVGGFADDECDGLWSFWSLRRLREGNARGGKGVCFADYLISSHCYEFRYEDAQVSSVYIEGTAERMASSVAEFLERYMSDRGSVWAWH